MVTEAPVSKNKTSRTALLGGALLLCAGCLGLVTYSAWSSNGVEIAPPIGAGRQLTERHESPRMEAYSLRGAKPKTAKMESVPLIGSQYTQTLKPKNKNAMVARMEAAHENKMATSTQLIVRPKMEAVPSIGSQYAQTLKPKSKNVVAARMEAKNRPSTALQARPSS